MIHTVKGFDVVNKAEIDVFFSGILLFFDDPEDVGNLISGSSAFSKTSFNIWKFTVYVLLFSPRPRSEKPQQDGKRWSGGCAVLEQL